MATRQKAQVPDTAGWDGATVAVLPGSMSGEAALDEASRLVAIEPFSAQVGFLLQHVGPYVTAAALGLSDARQLTKWWRGGEPKSPVMTDRVHLLFQAAYAITLVYAGETAARFLRSANPLLGDEAPMLLISGDPAEARVAVLAAVRVLVE